MENNKKRKSDNVEASAFQSNEMDTINSNLFDLKNVLSQLGDESSLEKKIPYCIIFGNQSAGKTSILHRIIYDHSGMNLEMYTSADCATKMVTKICFIRSKKDALKVYLNKPDGRKDVIDNDNPLKYIADFQQNCTIDDLKGFVAEIQIISTKVSDFCFVDLPGIFNSSEDETKESERNYIIQVVDYYLKNQQNCTVLHVVGVQTDLNNIESIKFLRKYNLKPENQIIVATQLDLCLNIQNGVPTRLGQLKRFFPNEKIFVVQPCDSNGYLTPQQEKDNLKEMINGHDFQIGISNLFEEIKSKLFAEAKRFVRDNYDTLYQLKQRYINLLENIGHEPVPYYLAMSHWRKTLNEICDFFFITNKKEILSLAEQSKSLIVVNYSKEQAIQSITSTIIECQENRGEQILELISFDAPFKKVLQQLAEHFKNILINFLQNVLFPELKKIFDNIIEKIRFEHPSCENATNEIEKEWLEKLEKIYQKFFENISADFDIRINNPALSRNINFFNLVSLITCQKYVKEAQRLSDDSSDDEGKLSNFERYLKNNLYSFDNADSIEKRALLVYEYVDHFWKQLSIDFSTELESKINQIGKDMKNCFIDSSIEEKISRSKDLVIETNETKNQRTQAKRLINVINSILN